MSILKEEKNGILYITLNRPEKKNALSLQMMQELSSILISIPETVRILVLEAKGSFFCAGLDLDDVMQYGEKCTKTMAEVFQALISCSAVTLVKVRGGAMAGGLGLVAACDFAYASSESLFSLPEMRRGLVPALVHTLLKRQCPARFLNELIFTGEPVIAAKAYVMCLINGVFGADDLERNCLKTITKILKSAPHAVKMYKVRQEKIDFTEALRLHAELFAFGEVEEGLRAFQEKRLPKWDQS